jgi:hypothetical protein
VEKSIPRRCPQWFPGTTPKSLILVSAQQFLRAGKVLLDEAGKPLFEGPDSAARAFIGGHVLAIEIAKANELALRFFEHVLPTRSLGIGEIGAGFDPGLSAKACLGEDAVRLAQRGFEAFYVAAAGELSAVAGSGYRFRPACGSRQGTKN